MRRLLLWLGLSAMALAQPPAPADLVLEHGHVYTLDASRSWAEAVAVAHGHLVYVGTDGGVQAWCGPGTWVVDLHGRMLLPAFEDSHCHPAEGGVDLDLCRLIDLRTVAQVGDAIRRYAKSHPDRPWVVGSGWDLPLFPAGSPRRELLDRLVPDRPAYLEAADGHSVWVNSKALQLSGIERTTPDPPHGRIERDATGEPSGTLREAAMDLVKVPDPTDDDYVAGIKRALAQANRLGIIVLYDAHVTPAMLRAYHTLDERHELTAQVTAALHTDPLRGPEQVDELVAERTRYEGTHFHPVAAKIFADGVMEAHTAALLSPYRTAPRDRGDLGMSPADFAALVVRLDRAGFQVHVHAIGDRAVRTALDAVAAAQQANGVHDARDIIAHLELVDPHDVPRFRALGVIADVQPLWAFRDNYIRDLTEPALGPERSSRLYPMGTLWRSGASMSAGSDWDVTSQDPLAAIEVAITRREPGSPKGPAWLPQETVDLPTVLSWYTIGAAYATHQETETGSIEVGKWADLIVLDHDLFAIPPTDIHKCRVLWTLLGGREVWCAPSYRTSVGPEAGGTP